MTTVTNPASSGPLPGAPTMVDGTQPAAAPSGSADPHWMAQSPGGYPSGGYPAEGYPAEGYPAEGYPPPYAMAPPGRFTSFMLRLWDRSPRWLAPVSIFTCLAGAAGYVLISDPTDDGANSVTTCLVKMTTGYDCPGCGGTRAFYYLLRGNLPAASRHHLLFVFAVPFLIYMYVAWAGQQIFRRSLPALRLPPLALSLFLAAWLVFSIVRNLPWEPFTWLYV